MKFVAFTLTAFFLAFIFPALAQRLSPDTLRFVVLGSSTASATGASVHDSGWVWRYAAWLEKQYPGSEVVNLAVGGYTTYHIQSTSFHSPEHRPEPDTIRNITTAIALHPSAIIVNLPSNDAVKRIPLAERVENLVRVANRAAYYGIPIWICTSQPRNMNAKQRRDLADMRNFILAAFPGTVLDFWRPIATRSGRIQKRYDSGDGVHLNDAGHRRLFETVRDARIPDRLRIPWRLPGGSAAVSLRILPYPAHDFVTFRVTTGPRSDYTIRIMNLNGRELQRLSGRSSHGVALRFFDPAGLRRGTYRVELRCGSSRVTKAMLLR